jgi:hypothetical protein
VQDGGEEVRTVQEVQGGTTGCMRVKVVQNGAGG